ncbi:MAG: type III-B CRISPR module-associated protein Cmr3 [Acidobacteria bacterium]|jgi:CRISPR-associated protein Cmr3|nr:MAG: type III-B CRISPR module-associated protein Cmr3 [Acidobacteriota bacterium]GIU81025.1 MAG: CRISPR-associated protein Cmr3 [Pyrinomonadaceae bacterium]
MSFELLIEPHDVLLFRDGRPFRAGEDTRARSLFPPTPFTVQGAIRARVLFSSGVSLADYASPNPSQEAQQLRQQIGVPGQKYGSLRLQGPLLARKENGHWKLYVPAPADVLAKESGGYALLKPLECKELRYASNLPDALRLPWVRTTDRPEEVRGWMSIEDLRRYLNGQAPQQVLSEEGFLIREPRMGIALESGRRTTREGHLYIAEFLRLKDNVALWVRVEGIQQQDFGPPNGFLQLGGEARAAYYRVLDGALGELPTVPNSLPERFKVALLTPAWFSGGWQPAGGNWSQFFSGLVRLVSAIVPRAQPIGGAYVDDQRRRTNFQKPMRRFVPAGSVYFFESDGTVTWNGKPFTETPSGEGDFGQIGFGFCAIGQWNYA